MEVRGGGGRDGRNTMTAEGEKERKEKSAFKI